MHSGMALMILVQAAFPKRRWNNESVSKQNASVHYRERFLSSVEPTLNMKLAICPWPQLHQFSMTAIPQYIIFKWTQRHNKATLLTLLAGYHSYLRPIKTQQVDKIDFFQTYLFGELKMCLSLLEPFCSESLGFSLIELPMHDVSSYVDMCHVH